MQGLLPNTRKHHAAVTPVGNPIELACAAAIAIDDAGATDLRGTGEALAADGTVFFLARISDLTFTAEQDIVLVNYDDPLVWTVSDANLGLDANLEAAGAISFVSTPPELGALVLAQTNEPTKLVLLDGYPILTLDSALDAVPAISFVGNVAANPVELAAAVSIVWTGIVTPNYPALAGTPEAAISAQDALLSLSPLSLAAAPAIVFNKGSDGNVERMATMTDYTAPSGYEVRGFEMVFSGTSYSLVWDRDNRSQNGDAWHVKHSNYAEFAQSPLWSYSQNSTRNWGVAFRINEIVRRIVIWQPIYGTVNLARIRNVNSVAIKVSNVENPTSWGDWTEIALFNNIRQSGRADSIPLDFDNDVAWKWIAIFPTGTSYSYSPTDTFGIVFYKVELLSTLDVNLTLENALEADATEIAIDDDDTGFVVNLETDDARIEISGGGWLGTPLLYFGTDSSTLSAIAAALQRGHRGLGAPPTTYPQIGATHDGYWWAREAPFGLYSAADDNLAFNAAGTAERAGSLPTSFFTGGATRLTGTEKSISMRDVVFMSGDTQGLVLAGIAVKYEPSARYYLFTWGYATQLDNHPYPSNTQAQGTFSGGRPHIGQIAYSGQAGYYRSTLVGIAQFDVSGTPCANGKMLNFIMGDMSYAAGMPNDKVLWVSGGWGRLGYITPAGNPADHLGSYWKLGGPGSVGFFWMTSYEGGLYNPFNRTDHVQVEMGQNQAIARRSDGTVDIYPFAGSSAAKTPPPIVNELGAVDVYTGYDCSCSAVLTDGSIVWWGLNGNFYSLIQKFKAATDWEVPAGYIGEVPYEAFRVRNLNASRFRYSLKLGLVTRD